MNCPVAHMPKTCHPLPADHAFVVQVHAAAQVEQGQFTGRVEHIVSGQATHFASREALLEFIARVLTAQRRNNEPGSA